MLVFQTRKLRHKEIKQLTQCHTTDMRENWDLDAGSLAPKPPFFAITPSV